MPKMLEPAHLWHAVRILAACALAYVAARLIGLREDYWALITAIVVTQPGLSETLSAGRDRVIGTLIGALAGLLVIAGQWGASTFALFWGCAGPACDPHGRQAHASPGVRTKVVGLSGGIL